MPNPSKRRSAVQYAALTDNWQRTHPAPTPDDASTAKRPVHALPAGSTAAHHQSPCTPYPRHASTSRSNASSHSANLSTPISRTKNSSPVSLLSYLLSSKHGRASKAIFTSNIINPMGSLGESRAIFAYRLTYLAPLLAWSTVSAGRQAGTTNWKVRSSLVPAPSTRPIFQKRQ
jgi:hypothetical protein